MRSMAEDQKPAPPPRPAPLPNPVVPDIRESPKPPTPKPSQRPVTGK